MFDRKNFAAQDHVLSSARALRKTDVAITHKNQPDAQRRSSKEESVTNRRISVFYDGSYYTFKWLKALLWAKNEFRRLQVDVSFISPKQYLPYKYGRDSISAALARKRFDVIFVAHHHTDPNGIGGLPFGALKDTLEQLKMQSNMLVWLDTADSTGTCKFEVMPFVDLYFKKQILAERERYYSPLWGGRMFCEYYHANHGIQDPEIEDLHYQRLAPDHLDKIRVSWNVGLADLFTQNKYVTYARPHTYSLPRFEAPSATRRMDVHFRGSAWSSAAGWQRTKARELLLQRNDLSHPDVGSRVSYDRYIAEIASCRAVVSPFGWGEICSRDFEALAYGATLLKPSMAHLNTYPNWYRESETYIPIDWHFDNFNEVLDGIRDRSKEYLAVAQNAQDLYTSYLVGNRGKMEFAQHVIKNLGWL
jgi:hypothetical protein